MCFKRVVKYCVTRRHKAVKLNAKIMDSGVSRIQEFLGFRCGKNKRKDKRKEPIMRKTEKIIEKVVEGRKKSWAAKSGQQWYVPIKDATKKPWHKRNQQNVRFRKESKTGETERLQENEVSNTVKKIKTKMHRFQRR